MSDEIRNDESSTDEVINDIVEETLEEQDAKTSVKAKGNAKDETPVSEPESIASVDKATKDSPDNSAKNKATIAPKTKAGMISAMVTHMQAMNKMDMQAMYNSYHNTLALSVEIESILTKLSTSVVDPELYGSVSFGRIQIHFKRYGSGSGKRQKITKTIP